MNSRVLLVTDGWDGRDGGTADRVEAALAALPEGVAAVQLRAKALSGRALFEAACALVARTRPRGALALVNDRVDVARAAGADGVHLPASGLSPEAARRAAGEAPRAAGEAAWRAGEGLVVGVSTHSLEEALRAAAGGADYVTFGPVFPTPSKAAFGPPVGLARLAEVVRALPIPVFALGGVGPAEARACLEVGARLACIGAVLGRPTPEAAAEGARALASLLPREAGGSASGSSATRA